MNRVKLVSIACFIAFILGSLLGSTFGVGSPQPAHKQASFRQYNNHWQHHQNEKMVICYQKMATMDAVTICMIRLGVFI